MAGKCVIKTWDAKIWTRFICLGILWDWWAIVNINEKSSSMEVGNFLRG
jgi:hypothetical protein